jgi:hypothetical protein
MPKMKFGSQEQSTFKQHLPPGQTTESIWETYSKLCHQTTVTNIFTWDNLSSGTNSSVPGSVMLLKGIFWFGREVLGRPIYERELLESSIRNRPGLFNINIPNGLSLHVVDSLAQIPYFLDDVSSQKLQSNNIVTLLLIDPDLYEKPE